MNIIVLLLLFSGLLFFTGGAIGILRFPDFYSRLHPAGKLDTAGQFLTLSAAALYVIHDLSLSNILTAAKIGLIVIFVCITSPTATHAIVDAGVRAGLRPWQKGRGDDLAD
jgi:multicomponent Na+:H+ antiporter subunit G